MNYDCSKLSNYKITIKLLGRIYLKLLSIIILLNYMNAYCITVIVRQQ